MINRSDKKDIIDWVASGDTNVLNKLQSYIAWLFMFSMVACNQSPHTVETSYRNTDLNKLHYDVVVGFVNDINNELQQWNYIVWEPQLEIKKNDNEYEATLSAILTSSDNTYHTMIKRRWSWWKWHNAEEQVEKSIQQPEPSLKDCNIDTVIYRNDNIFAKEIFYKYYK